MLATRLPAVACRIIHSNFELQRSPHRLEPSPVTLTSSLHVAGPASRDGSASPSVEGQERYLTARQRRELERERALRRLGKQGQGSGADSGHEGDTPAPVPAEPAAEAGKHESLLIKAARARETEPEETEAERLLKMEEEIMRQLMAKKALKGVQELARDVVYAQRMETGWRPPVRVRLRGEAHHEAIRKTMRIEVDGADLPPPVTRFEDLRLPAPLIRHLKGKGIDRPTPIQVQGIPVALSGRDMIGVAFTGSGKTMVFTLPMVVLSLQEELRMPLLDGEGPLGFILAPSRELARQTAQIAEAMCRALEDGGYPRCVRVKGGAGNPRQTVAARAAGKRSCRGVWAAGWRC